jgi:hypothetical protein
VVRERASLRIDRETLKHLEPTLGVAPDGVFDFQHLGAPVSKNAAGCGDESELRDLQYPDAFHDLGHCQPLLDCFSVKFITVTATADTFARTACFECDICWRPSYPAIIPFKAIKTRS